MKKLKLGLLCAVAFFLMGGIVSCQSEDIVPQQDDNSVVVNAVAHVTVGEQTRTSFTPSTSSFDFAWSENDQIVVISEDGTRNIGVMTLVSGAGNNYGEFEGKLNVRESDANVHIYYMGRRMTTGLKSLSVSQSYNVSAQSTTLASITDYDIMHASSSLEKDGKGNVSMDFKVRSLVSSARFRFHLPESVTATNEAVTITGRNIYNTFTLDFANAILSNKEEGKGFSIVPDWSNAEGGDAFMMLVPATDAVTEFAVTVNNTNYKAALDPMEYEASCFYCGGNPLHGKDIYFTKNGEWTLKYDANGGQNGPSDMTANSFSPSYQFTIVDDTPECSGYTFLGWADTNDATEVKYAAGSTVTITRPETSKTIYAVWKKNGAEGDITAPSSKGTDY